MKILILGNSNIFQRKVLPALTKIKNLKMELASKSLKSTNIRYEKIYNNYEHALNETTANLVYISLVNSLHYKWAIKSLEYNKNLIIDKPITLNLDQTKKITKDDINKAYTKIQKKIHPDISPETARLSSLVNEARDVLLKNFI